ncbi:MAG: hypothetical protein MUC36_00670 [Planctomycetes bacterium]|jgi:hypothetical protein|nr:hypothetical protein [Planctomycetota bacterium]
MPEPELQATFTFSNADLADVLLRSLRRQPELRRRRLLTALALGVFGLVIASLLLVLLPTESPVMQWALPVAGALAPIVTFLLRWPATTRAALQRWAQQQHGMGPHTCSIALLPSGVYWEQSGDTGEHPWRNVTRIRLTGDDIEFDGPALTVVRRRAFASDDARDRFLQAALRLRADAVRAST